jgi:hypothetical protein
MKKIYLTMLIMGTFFFSPGLQAQSVDLQVRKYHVADLPVNQLHHFSNAVRTVYYQLDLAKLDELSVFKLELFDGNVFTFKFKKSFQYKTGSQSWYGESVDGNGDIIFSFYQGNIQGTLKDNSMKKYMFQQINLSDVFAITEVNVESMQESAAGVPDYLNAGSGSHKKSRANADVCAAATNCGAASVIDLMVLGNADAITDAGGTVPAFIADVTTAVTEMNTAYTSSGGTLLSFDLVHCDSYVFMPTANPSSDLSTFRNDPAVTLLRDMHFADLCGLWVGSGTYAGACGIGYLNTNPTDYNDMAAFTVTDFNCGMTNLTYAHECGHNMGLRHDYYVDASTSPCDHHHGYTNQVVIPAGLPVAGRWRTIMAYNNECADNGFNCTRLPRWANPSLNYLGDAMGRAIGIPQPTDEIYGFERFRCIVSGFRNAGVPLPMPTGSFSGKAIGSDILLSWKTNADLNSKGFDLEMKRSFSEDFSRIAYTPAKNTGSGLDQYEYILNDARAGVYYFRLKSADKDDHFTYSPVIKVEVSGGRMNAMVYPNPAKDNFKISFNNPGRERVSMIVFDMAGKEVSKMQNVLLEAGQQQIEVSVKGLNKGIYFCQIISGQDKSMTKLLIE